MAIVPTKQQQNSSPVVPKAAAIAAGEYQNGGLFPGAASGRADTLKASVDPESYIIPADVVSALGDGNTSAGADVLDGMFGQDAGEPQAPEAPPQNPDAPQIPRQQFAAGGMPQGMPTPPPMPAAPQQGGAAVPIRASSGEYQVKPQTVAALGDGDIKHGHDVLDHFVKQVRAKYKKHLNKLPSPNK